MFFAIGNVNDFVEEFIEQFFFYYYYYFVLTCFHIVQQQKISYTPQTIST